MAITVDPSSERAWFQVTGYRDGDPVALIAGGTPPNRQDRGFLRDSGNQILCTNIPGTTVMDRGFVRDGVLGPVCVSTAAIANTRAGIARDASGWVVVTSLV